MIYRHLRLPHRITIEYLLARGCSQADIARQLKVHRSTVQREIARNSSFGGYNAQLAQSRSRKRKYRGETARDIMRQYPGLITYKRRRWKHHGRYADRRPFRWRAYLLGVGYLYNFTQSFRSYGRQPDRKFCKFVEPVEKKQEENVLKAISPPVKKLLYKPLFSPFTSGRMASKTGLIKAGRGEVRPDPAYDTS